MEFEKDGCEANFERGRSWSGHEREDSDLRFSCTLEVSLKTKK